MSDTITLRRAAEMALEAIIELEYSNSTAVADSKARNAKRALRSALSAAPTMRPATREEKIVRPGVYEVPATPTAAPQSDTEWDAARFLAMRLWQLLRSGHPCVTDIPEGVMTDLCAALNRLDAAMKGDKP